MTSSILLIRHAAHPHLGSILSGRTPGIDLSPEGRSQALALARRLSRLPLDRLHASPVQRAQDTASVLATAREIGVDTVAALDELDFGDWAGRAFVELADDPRWGEWNRSRATATAPRGESMVEAQQRAWAHIEASAAAFPGGTLAMVTHCDIIRSVVAHVLDLSLDRIHQFEIAPASVTRLQVGAWGAKVISVNETCDA